MYSGDFLPATLKMNQAEKRDKCNDHLKYVVSTTKALSLFYLTIKLPCVASSYRTRQQRPF